MPHGAALTLALALATGVIGQTLSRHIRAPGIIALLILGILLGPEVLGLIRPDDLGGTLYIIVGSAVAVILFEGGLQLEGRRLQREAAVIRRLISVGALITALVCSMGAHWVLQWDLPLSILFGTLVIVTGPTVVTPLLRSIKVQRNISTILEAEGVLIDPIGALIAVIVHEIIMTAANDAFVTGISDLFLRLGGGVLIGGIGGYILGQLLRSERWVPRELENIFTLSWVILLFEGSNTIMAESGIATVTVAGVIVGNMNLPAERRIIEFKEQLTTMLIGFLFVILAADISLSSIIDLGWPGVIVVGVVMFVARPINVFFSTYGSNLNWREKTFMCWLAPRGIVAAAVASLFAHDLEKAGISGGEELRALVFLVIASTVVLQGLSAGPVAALLSLRRAQNNGYVCVGANAIARTLAQLLSSLQGKTRDQLLDLQVNAQPVRTDNESSLGPIKLRDLDRVERGSHRTNGQLGQLGQLGQVRTPEEVVIIDRSASEASIAEKAGLRVLFGNALEEGLILRSHAESRRGIICLTPDGGTNMMVARRMDEHAREVRKYVALSRSGGINEELLHGLGFETLFVAPHDFPLWIHRLTRGTGVLGFWEYQGDQPLTLSKLHIDQRVGPTENSLLPLATGTVSGSTSQAKDMQPKVYWSPAFSRRTLKKGEWLAACYLKTEGQVVDAWLNERGFVSIEHGSESPA